VAKKMKAAVVHAFCEPLRVEDVQASEPGYGQVLVKVETSGVCHADLQCARNRGMPRVAGRLSRVERDARPREPLHVHSERVG